MKRTLLILLLLASIAFGNLEVTEEGVLILSQDGLSQILLSGSDIAGEGIGIFANLTVNNLNTNSRIYTDAQKTLTTTPPVAGTLGFWTRTTGPNILTVATAGDAITDGILIITEGNIVDAGNITLTQALTAGTGLFGNLTSGRVVFVSTNGLLIDDSDFTFTGGIITATGFVGDLTGNADTATISDNVIDFDYGDVSVSSGTWTVETVAGADVPLGIGTTGNYVESVATTSPLNGGTAGSEGATLTLTLDVSAIDTNNLDAKGIDHGELDGLGDDDHTQYLLVDGTRAFTGVVGGITPTANAHLTTKLYVDTEVADAYAFKTIAGITNDVVADAVDDTLTLASGNNILGIVGTTATDTITFTIDQSNVDHGSLAGLSDVADHAYALLHNGSRNLSGNWNLGGFNLTNGGEITGTSLKDGTATLSGGNLTGMGNITGDAVDISAGTGDYSSSGTIISGNITIFGIAPILVFKDSNDVGAATVGFIEWRDSNNIRLGFFGNSSSGNDDLLWKNESSGGHIKIETTGAGEFQIFADTVLNGSLTAAGTIEGTSLTDGTATLSGGHLTGMGNITGSGIDISAGTGDYTTTGLGKFGELVVNITNAGQKGLTLWGTSEEGFADNRGGFIRIGNSASDEIGTTGYLYHNADAKLVFDTIIQTTYFDVGNAWIDFSNGSTSFGNHNFTISSTGVMSAVTGSTIGTLTFADGSITDSGDSISFGSENLDTLGTLSSGELTATDIISNGIGTNEALIVNQGADDKGIQVNGFDDISGANIKLIVDQFGQGQLIASSNMVNRAGGLIFFGSGGDILLELGDIAGNNRFRIRKQISPFEYVFDVDSLGNTRIWGDTYWVGDGSGIPFGHIYANNTIAVSVTDTTPIEVGDTWIAGELNLTTFGASHYLIVTKAGRYKIDWNMSVHADIITGGTIEIEGNIMIDGTVHAAGGQDHITLANILRNANIGASVIIDLAANKQISLAIINETNGDDIDVEHANITVTMVGGT